MSSPTPPNARAQAIYNEIRREITWCQTISQADRAIARAKAKRLRKSVVK